MTQMAQIEASKVRSVPSVSSVFAVYQSPRNPSLLRGSATDAIRATVAKPEIYQKNTDSIWCDLNQSATYSAVPPNNALASAYAKPIASALTSVGNSSAFTIPLIEV